ncbi:hypothetical protein [Nonomuraea sp. NPDC023979]|uniref:hypothetical protein n=1 Tax=Nonomuraea sp. NPDC023979 TaxID=3154796 RepID=UPI0033F05E9C
MTTPANVGRWGKPGPHRPNCCRYCGRFGRDCQRAVCLACDTPQCWDSACAVCLVGLFTTRNFLGPAEDLVCGYRCTNLAVARVPRVGYACRTCLPRPARRWNGESLRLADEIAQRVAELGQTRDIPGWRRFQWYDT